MYIIQDGDIIASRVYCLCTAGGSSQLSVNSQYWRCVGNTAAPDYTTADFALKFDQLAAAAWKGAISADATYLGVSAQYFRHTPLLVPSDEAPSYSNAFPGVGTGGTDLIPTQAAPVLTFKTQTKRCSGRNYIPFPAASVNDTNGTPTAGYLVLLAAINTMLSAGVTLNGHANVATFSQVVYRPQIPLHVTPPAVPDRLEGFFDVTQWKVADKFGTQRRRGIYGKQNVSPF